MAITIRGLGQKLNPCQRRPRRVVMQGPITIIIRGPQDGEIDCDPRIIARDVARVIYAEMNRMDVGAA